MTLVVANVLTERVVNWCIVLGVVSIAAGIAIGVFEFLAERNVKLAAAKAAEDVQTVAPSGAKAGDSAAQGAIASAVKSVAELATALKDLERSSRLLVIGVAFFAIAAVAAGADAIAEDADNEGTLSVLSDDHGDILRSEARASAA
jgi:hypothetical protein